MVIVQSGMFYTDNTGKIHTRAGKIIFQRNDICNFLELVPLCTNCIYAYLHRVWMRLGLPKFRPKLGGCQIRENFPVCFLLCLRRTKESDCHDIVLQRFIGFCVYFLFTFFAEKKLIKKPTMKPCHATYWSSLESIIPVLSFKSRIVIL